MVTVGLAVTEAPVVAERPVAGLQLYVAAPVAVSVVDAPAQIATLAPPLTVGNVFTVSVNVVEPVQPTPEVPTMV